MNNYLEEVRSAIKPHANKKRGMFLQGYLNTKFPVLGLSSPEQRVVSKQGFSFLVLPQKEIDSVWLSIWQQGKEFEVLSQCLLYYGYHQERLGLAEWAFLKTWVERVDNWAHSDMLSDLLAGLHEQHPSVVFPQYVQWNKSPRPWAVRQSLVGLFYYARSREKQPSFARVIRMVKGAFAHPDLYVQKGVGWTLRECYNTYPEETWAFLVGRARSLSPVAWQAATEKLFVQQKLYLKHLRKLRI